MSDSQVKVTITADAGGAVAGFDIFGRKVKQVESDTASTVAGIKTHWLALTAAVTASAVAVSKAWDMVKAGAEYEEQRGVLNNLSRQYSMTADTIVAAMARASSGMISNANLMTVALGGISKGLNPDQLINLADAAKILSDAAGKDATTALTDLTQALETGRVRGIKGYAGATLDLRDAFGDLESKMSATDKTQAMYLMTMVHATKLQKEQTGVVDETADKIERLEAQYKNLTTSMSVAFKTAVVGLNDFLVRYSGGPMDPASIGARALNSLLFDKKAATGPGVYEVPPLGKPGEKDPLADYLKQLDALKKALAAKSATNEADKSITKTTDSWKEMEATLKGEISKSGLSGLTRDLIENQLRAEKLKEQFIGLSPEIKKAAYALIDKAKARADSTARIKEENQAQQDYLDMLEEGTRLRARFDEFAKDNAYGGMDELERELQIVKDIEQSKFVYIQEMLDRGVIAHAEAEAAKLAATQERTKAEMAITSEKFVRENAELQGIASATANMFSMAAGLYAEDSSERKKLSDLSKAATMAEIALQVQKNLMIAVGAVVNQGTGDPYTAFARIAAMIGVVAGVLSIAGIAFSGGSTGGSASMPQHASHSSTIFGAAAGTASNSLENSLALLEDTYDMTDTRLRQIHRELKDLNSNITGLVRNITMTGGIGNFGSTYWETPGMEEAQWAKDISGLWGGNIFDKMDNPLGKIFSAFKYFDPLAGSISLFAKLMGSMFGGGTETTQYAGGIKIGGKSIEDIIAEGVSAQEYASYVTKTDGGWFGKDSNSLWERTKALDEDVNNVLSLMFGNMSKTLVSLAEGLGADVDKVLQYAFGDIKINLMGKTGEAMAKALMEKFSEIGDKAVSALFGDLVRGYQKLNEGLLETAVRLVTEKEIVLRMLEATNQRFNGTIPAALKFSQALIEIAGGLDRLTDSMQTYYDAFFNDAEKQERLKQQLTQIMSSFGFDLPGSRSGYRELVESLDLTTTAGMHAYAALMELASGADQYYDYLEQRRASVRESDYATRVEYERAVRGFAGGGYHPGGYRVVGERGAELEYTGPSTIHSTQDSRRALGTDEMLAELRKLREEVGQANFTSVVNSNKIAKLLDQWNGEGLPETRT